MKTIEKITLIPTSLAVGGLVSSVIALATRNNDLMNAGLIIGAVASLGMVGCFGAYTNNLIKEEENKKAKSYSLKLNAGCDYFGE